jgi:hypothetical protein
MAAWALAYAVGDLDAGSGLVGRALAQNPNVAAAWGTSGWVNTWLGNP